MGLAINKSRWCEHQRSCFDAFGDYTVLMALVWLSRILIDIKNKEEQFIILNIGQNNK